MSLSKFDPPKSFFVLSFLLSFPASFPLASLFLTVPSFLLDEEEAPDDAEHKEHVGRHEKNAALDRLQIVGNCEDDKLDSEVEDGRKSSGEGGGDEPRGDNRVVVSRRRKKMPFFLSVLEG